MTLRCQCCGRNASLATKCECNLKVKHFMAGEQSWYKFCTYVTKSPVPDVLATFISDSSTKRSSTGRYVLVRDDDDSNSQHE